MNLIGRELQSADINCCYKLSKELAAKLKGTLKLCFTRYLCVIIILFSTVLCKSYFYTYSFGNIVPRLSLLFLCSFFWIWWHPCKLYSIYIPYKVLCVFVLILQNYFWKQIWHYKSLLITTFLQSGFEYFLKNHIKGNYLTYTKA